MLDSTNFFSGNNYKTNDQNNITLLKINMAEEASFEFRLKRIDETRSCENYKKTCKCFNYIEHFLILVSAITGYASFSSFASLVCIPAGITSSAVGTNICGITAVIKNYKSFIKKRKKNLDKIVLSGINKLITIEVLFSKTLIDSCISHEELF